MGGPDLKPSLSNSLFYHPHPFIIACFLFCNLHSALLCYSSLDHSPSPSSSSSLLPSSFSMDSRCPFVVFSLVLLCAAVAAGAGNVELAEKCGDEFQKVVVCLEYATGREATPTKDCCSSVKSIKDSNPECLCFLIQQTGNGSDKLKSMGVQEAKLLQLPSACELKNASISDCPKVLGISPSSPDAAIFTNNGSSGATPSTSASATTKSPSSYAARPEPSIGSLTVTAVAVLLTALPLGSLLLLPSGHT